MSLRPRQLIYFLAAFLVIAGCTWWWYANMEKRWTARPQISDAAAENPMFAATRLLGLHRHAVKTVDTLADTLRTPLPDGTLMLPENGGMVTRAQSAQLLAWVRRGNTLILRPRWSTRTRYLPCGDEAGVSPPPPKSAADGIDADPIAAYLGVELVTMTRRRKDASAAVNPVGKKPEEPTADETTPDNAAANVPAKAQARPVCLASLTLPEAGYALQLDVNNATLQSTGKSLTPLFADGHAEAVRVYAEGKGHIAVVAGEYFDNYRLAMYDHAELLLALTELNRNARHVLVVQHLDMPSWYQALWWRFQLGIVSLACGLLLLFWLALRRFGPMLPEPDQERRSLIEHIDASGRWLWAVPGGRDILLAATRDSVNRILMRHAPELLRLPLSEQTSYLARYCKLPHDDVVLALRQPAAKLPIDFTRQIQTLQQLRKHHER